LASRFEETRRMKRVVILLVTVAAPMAQASGQTQYFNLEAGRPTRIEDAEPTERYGLDVQLAPVRVEWLGGAMRWRAEPKISLGALPFTEFDLRVPYVGVRSRDTSGVRESGVTSLAVGMLHALNVETMNVPGLAIGAEVQMPVGRLAAPKATYSLKALATKSGKFGRVHLNVAGGTYSVRVPTTDSCTLDPSGFGCGGFIPDAPCSLGPVTARERRASAMCSAPALGAATVGSAMVAASAPRTHGARWLAGVGVDHSFPLASLLVTADLVSERFEGFQSGTDVTAESGVRWQVSPRLVLDAGVARRFTGAAPSWSLTSGITFSSMIRPRSVVAGAPHATR
jgi:hypothetical protein